MDEETKNPPKLMSRDSTFLNQKSEILRNLGLPMKKKKNIKKSRKSTIEKQREISTEHILQILIKPRSTRNILENKILGEYLSQKYDYFKRLKESEPSKLEKICKFINYETFSPKETIINYGEPGDKFYIVFNGLVGVYKPIYIEKIMSLNEFYSYMLYLKKMNKIYKMKRIMEKNKHLNLDLNILSLTPEDSYYMRKKLTFIIEEDEKLGEFSNGFSFGEIALIKKTKRNATVISIKHSSLLSIEKFDYNNVIRRLEEKRLEKEIYKFKINYPFLTNFSNSNVLDIINCFQHLRFVKGEFLYKQNEDSDSIYFIKEGTFEMYSYLSFAWLHLFYKYIINSENNLFKKLEEYNPQKESDLFDMLETIKKNIIPCPSLVKRKINRLKKQKNFGDNVFDIKSEEDELNDPENLFKVNIKKIDYKDIIGLEETMELKKRFCSVKCVSSVAYVEKIKIIYLLELLNFKLENKARISFENLLLDKKIILINLLKNSVKNQVNIIENNFEKKYNLILENNIDKLDEESKNKQISTIKLRGWSKDIDNILDEDIHFHKFPKLNTLSKETEKRIFGQKQINEIIFPQKIQKPIKSFYKNKFQSNENLRLFTSISNNHNNNFNLNLVSLKNNIKKRNFLSEFSTVDYGSSIEKMNKSKNCFSYKKKKLIKRNKNINSESNLQGYSSAPDLINNDNNNKSLIKIKKKIFFESFNSAEKNFFLGENFSNKMKNEINKNRNICLGKTQFNFSTNLSSIIKK